MTDSTPRRFRFSLRTLFVMVTVVAILAGFCRAYPILLLPIVAISVGIAVPVLELLFVRLGMNFVTWIAKPANPPAT